MEALENETRIVIVVEGRLALAPFDVTGCTGFVFELALMHGLVRVTTGAIALAILEFRGRLRWDLGLRVRMAARTGIALVLAEKAQTEFCVIDFRALEGLARLVALKAICCRFHHGM